MRNSAPVLARRPHTVYKTGMRTTLAKPIALPPVLRKRIAATAKATKLPAAAVMQQAILLGLPVLRAKHAAGPRRLVNVAPLPAKIWRRIYSDASLDEGYAIDGFIAAQAWPEE